MYVQYILHKQQIASTFCTYYNPSMSNKVIRRGRPPKEGETATSRIELRLTPEQKESYQNAANTKEKKLSAWIKNTLDKAASRAVKK